MTLIFDVFVSIAVGFLLQVLGSFLDSFILIVLGRFLHGGGAEVGKREEPIPPTRPQILIIVSFSKTRPCLFVGTIISVSGFLHPQIAL